MNGIVVAIDPKTAKVRVQFPDRDGLVSDWLPVGQRKTLGDFDYWLPDMDTQVVCLMDEHCEAGVVICAVYSDADQPPVNNPDLFYRKFKDGTVLQYDRATHQLLADVKGDVIANATGDCTVTVQGHTLIKSIGDVEIDGGSGGCMGIVTKACICAFTGKPHADYSLDVTASKG